MSTLYNLLAGNNPYQRMALAVIALDRNTIPRFRDAAFTRPDDPYNTESPWLVNVLTRTGGPNRYIEENDKMVPVNTVLEDHPLYVSDLDMAADPTYAVFNFRFPDELKGLGRWIAETEPLMGDARVDAWIKLFNVLGKLLKTYPRSQYVLSMKTWITPVMQQLVDEGKIDVKDAS